MDLQFQRKLRKSRGRQRYYSSMNYIEYVQFFGPPAAPFIKPQVDPQQIPDLILDEPLQNCQLPDKQIDPTYVTDFKLETIQQIDGSQNHTINQLRSPKKSFDFKNVLRDHSPKRSHSRMRSQSQNSQYLIFNFLDRFSKKQEKIETVPKKKLKCQ